MRVVSKILVLSLGLASNVYAEDSVSGFFRWQKNRLNLTSGCAVTVSNGTFVVLSSGAVDCSAGSSDPKQAIDDKLTERAQGSVSFTVTESGVVNQMVSFQTWSPLDSVTLSSAVKSMVADLTADRVSGKFSSGGVQIIPMDIDKELETELSFDLTVEK